MSNVNNIIKGFNKVKLEGGPDNNGTENCNCRENPCPLAGKCNVKDIIYEGLVTDKDDNVFKYLGLSSTKFIERFRGHKNSVKYSENRTKTQLSKKVWELKDDGQFKHLKFNIHKKSKSYQAGDKVCQLCLDEKVAILTSFKLKNNTFEPINSRDEVFSACKHRARRKLSNL